MLLSAKILLLLWLINFAPPLLSHFAGEWWNAPLDRDRMFLDKKPIFGPHKTVRGILAALAVGLAAGTAMGLGWWVGLLSGIFSMAGDLLSSFIKRRIDLDSGSLFPGLDQVYEGLFPFLVLGPQFNLHEWEIGLLVTLFCVGAYLGSIFFKGILLVKPFEAYPRILNPRVRLRELRACQITSNPLHHFLNFEDAVYYHFVMQGVFRMLGIYEKGKRNALQIEVLEHKFHFPDLPPAFQGYRLLFLSDLHLDGLEGLTERIEYLVRDLSVDLCILGGDFRMATHGSFRNALEEVRRLVPKIQMKDGIYGVLGNHDCLEIVEPLGKIGVKFLVNDAVAIERNGQRLWIVGVDDPHYYKCHDLKLAFNGVPHEDFVVFVAHSNEIYREASQYGPKLYLCGHTHAGQIQVPPFGPVFTHSRAPRSLCRGTWQYGNMKGYTSCGVGVSGVPLRFFSHGEVTVITLNGVPSD